MTEQQAETIHVGSEVEYHGIRCWVMRVKLRGIAGPYFGLFPIGECSEQQARDVGGLTSYLLCDLPKQAD
jgi:hypothetical protein